MAKQRRKASKRPSPLEELVAASTAHAFVGTVSVAAEKYAEALAQEALADPEFRDAWRALVRQHARRMLARLADGEPLAS